MSISNNPSVSRKPYVPLKTKYEALKETNPKLLKKVADRATNSYHCIEFRKQTKPTQYLDDIQECRRLWNGSNFGNFAASVLTQESGNGFLVRNKKRTAEELDTILKYTIHNLQDLIHPDANGDRLWQTRLPIERVTIDIFGNFKQEDPVGKKYRKNNIDPLAYPTLHKNVKPDYEIDPAAKKYRELIAKQLINPEHKVHSLSTEHYNVYQAHDNTKKHPHLLIIPNHKKYKNLVDLIERGTDEELKDYLKVLEKVANEGPRLDKLEHELFIADSGNLQKVPFFYTEYIPRRNEGMPEEYNSHASLKDISIGDIKQGDMKLFKKPDIKNSEDLAKFLAEHKDSFQYINSLRSSNKINHS